jgi:glycosyltransferase involved in cell wall biosynthesis
MMESMGCGTVPVVTCAGDHDEVIRRSGAGASVAVTSDEASVCAELARSALVCLQSANTWNVMSERARAFVAAEHSSAATAEDWTKVLESIGHDPTTADVRASVAVGT